MATQPETATTLHGGEAIQASADAEHFHIEAWSGAATIDGFTPGVDAISAITVHGYVPWVLEAEHDGVLGTEYRYGWNDDVVFLPGVTGVSAEVLQSPSGGDGLARTHRFEAWDGAATIEGFEVGLDQIETHTAYGYVPWVREAWQDGIAGTELVYGWNDDAVFLPGVAVADAGALLAADSTIAPIDGPAIPPAETPDIVAPPVQRAGVQAPQAADGAFRTVFYDGFDQDGDLSQWHAIMSGPHHSGMWWNPDGVQVHDGELEVSADLGDNGWYTGAGVAIEYGPDALGVDFGRIEVRARWDGGQGIAPAIMGWPSEDNAWPPEFDLMEVTDADGQWVATTNHWQGPGGNGDDWHDTSWTQVDSTQWHTYAVEWTPQGITYSIDGSTVYTGGADQLPNQPMTVAIGVFVGTWATQGWVPLPDASTPEHVGLHVDYVRMDEWIG